jgi:hypothetical protein
MTARRFHTPEPPPDTAGARVPYVVPAMGRAVRTGRAEEVRLQPRRYGDTVGFRTSLVSDDKDVTVRTVSLTTPCLVLRSGPAPAPTGDLLDAQVITLRGVYRAGRDDGRPVTRRDCIGGKGDWLGYALQGPIYLALPTR